MKKFLKAVTIPVLVLVLIYSAIILVYASGPKFKHKDKFIQREFQSVYSRIDYGFIVPLGITPIPDKEGALFLDTDAGANGTLKMYSNGAWRTVTAF